MKTVLSVILFTLFCSGAIAQTRCQNDSLRVLFANDPVGAHLYKMLAPDEKWHFLNPMLCKQIRIVELAVGVYDTTRFFGYQKERYFMADGTSVPTVGLPSDALKPCTLASSFDGGVEQYYLLTDKKTGSNFHYLLNALNAHSVALKSAVNLAKSGLLPAGGARVSLRDRLASVMLMVKIYLEKASHDYVTWNEIKKDDRVESIKALWVQAHHVIQEACKIPGLGMKDYDYLQLVYNTDNMNGLQQILGGAYAANIPVECRKSNR